MPVRFIERIAAIPEAVWNRLFPADYPFAQHAFLAALERHGCAAPATGWQPHHALLEDENGLVAALPLYLKRHSYGEFVFDFAWAEASHRLGQPYYPKLLCAIPFTPAQGPRIGARDAASRETLACAFGDSMRDQGRSSVHALFLNEEDRAALIQDGGIERHDIQFHWHNRGYTDFADFLARLSSEKRKKIQRERRRITEAGLRFEHLAGDELDEAQWAEVHALYSNTYEERGQAPYLSLDFFLDYGRAAGTPVRLIVAREDRRMVAVAITVRGGNTLYGRHWGAAERYHSLHFETCYYQGIELCIAQGLARFDAGAQGEHKLARGFEPVRTCSVHRLADRRLHTAVARALALEREQVARYLAELAAHAPFKREAVVAQ